MSDSLKKLQSLLIGKTIKDIQPPNASEAICKFVLTDGSSFRLHATELGFWIENTKNEKQEFYSDLGELIIDYDHYDRSKCSYDEIPPVHIDPKDDYIIIFAKDGTEFKGKISHFNKEDQILVTHAVAEKLISECANLGDCWQIFLNHKQYPDICPKELCRGKK